ncbi:AI-2E family transporter [Desulfolutivibrio sulfodismutans]|uniref:AI-2E family transporter n=1 Tax=Desulfolutivibrio sulfodismutans TaxID=63561 RepID=UPI001FE53469|nr:AI-2E family transporter [Desulfolutivibrio sulfodismutans]
MFDDRPFTFDRVVRLALTAGLLWGIVSLLGYLSDVLAPFVMALVLAYLINPLVNLLERRLKKRTLAVIAALTGVTLAAVALILLVAPMIVGEMTRMGRLLSEFMDNSDLARRAADRLPPDLWKWVRDFAARDDVRAWFAQNDVLGLAKEAASRILPGVWGVISGTADVILGLVGVFVVGLYLVFLLLDYAKVRHWQDYVPERYRTVAVDFVTDFEGYMNRYFRAQAILASAVGVTCAVGFSLIGLPLAILLGLFVGVLNMVPYLQLLAVPLAVLLGLLHSLEANAGFLTILALIALVFIVGQLVQDVILGPRILGKAMGLSPVLMLLSLSVWGKLLGFLGLLIALPMTCLCLAWYRRAVPAPVPETAASPD